MGKKIVAAILCAMLIVTMGISAFASDDVMPCYTYTSTVSASLSISSGTATAKGSIVPYNSRPTSVKVQLQRYSDGQWSTISTWKDSDTGGVSSAGGTKTVTSGYSYRTFVTGYVYDSDGVVIEVVSCISNTKTY